MLYTLQQLGWKPFFQQQLHLEELNTFYPARIAETQRGHVTLWSEQAEQHCQRELFRSLEPVTVGDWVLMPVDNPHPGRLLERQTVIKRKAAGTDLGEQLIAANLDTLLIVSSCNQDFNEARLERYLALAMEAGITPVLVLTKIDLVDSANDFINRAQTLHRGIIIETVNALDSETLTGLMNWCGSGQTLALVGSSGVGKSTLINSLTASHLITKSIREDDSKGRHTTTSRSLHWLKNGSLLIDTPGMRELQLFDCEEGIDSLFDDINQYFGQCRFSDCQHDAEPGCAIQQAITSGELSQRRWDSYLKLQQEQGRNQASLVEKRSRDKKLGRYYKSVQKEASRRKKR